MSGNYVCWFFSLVQFDQQFGEEVAWIVFLARPLSLPSRFSSSDLIFAIADADAAATTNYHLLSPGSLSL